MCLRSPVFGQCCGEVFRRRTRTCRGNVSGCACSDEPSAGVTGTWAEFDDVIGDGHDAHIEFDHDNGVAGIDE